MDSVGYLISVYPRITALTDALRERFGVIPVFACELEWYIQAPRDAAVLAGIWRESGQEVKAESGPNQFETAWEPTRDAAGLADSVEQFRRDLAAIAERHDARVNFAAKPFADQRGSALQIHIHLEDKAGKRLFEKRDGWLSDPLKFSLGGLLATLPDSMAVFASTPESRKRYVPGEDAPTTISWGGNNRTVALRLPLKSGPMCHIEHRVPAADADVAACIAAILEGVLYGLEHQCDPGPQTHGNAHDAQYDLPKL